MKKEWTAISPLIFSGEDKYKGCVKESITFNKKFLKNNIEKNIKKRSSDKIFLSFKNRNQIKMKIDIRVKVCKQ